MTPLRLRIFFGGVLAGALPVALLLPPGARAFEADRVMAFCQAGFMAAMTAASRTPPAGMADFTCGCFVERVRAGTPIDEATTVCRDQAAKRFPLAAP
jgi:hypothetical protein